MTHHFQEIDGKPHRVDPGATRLDTRRPRRKKYARQRGPGRPGDQARRNGSSPCAYERWSRSARTNHLMPTTLVVAPCSSQSRDARHGRLGGLRLMKARARSSRPARSATSPAQKHHHHQHVRPSDHSGRGVGDVPSHARLPLAGAKSGFMRSDGRAWRKGGSGVRSPGFRAPFQHLSTIPSS